MREDNLWEATVNLVIKKGLKTGFETEAPMGELTCPLCEQGHIDEAWNPPGCVACLVEFTSGQIKKLRAIERESRFDESSRAAEDGRDQ